MKIEQAIALSLCIFLCGCWISPVDESRLGHLDDLRLFDPNNLPYDFRQEVRIDPETGEEITHKIAVWNMHIKSAPEFVLAYDKLLYRIVGNIFVPVEIPGGRRHRAVTSSTRAWSPKASRGT